jgi:hypothetical protein
VELVLGVSMTPTTVRLALVEGEKADGVIVDHDVFDINTADGSATSRASDEVIAAVLGTQEGAIAAGHHLVSTGVTWTDRAEAAVLREALVARGIEGVLLVSELHAAAALAQAIGRAVGYDKTALMFVERETATLAVVETADGSVVKVLSESLHDGDAIAAAAEMVTAPEVQQSVAEALFVVGAGVDVTAVKAHLSNVVAVPVIAPEEPHLALARGAALASANAPRYDASTIGLAYSQDPDGTTAQSISAIDLVGHDDVILDASANASDADAPDRSKPFLLVGSSLTAIFIAGIIALTIAVAVNVRPTADQDSNHMPVHPGTPAPLPVIGSAPPAAAKEVPDAVPAPAPTERSDALIATARLKVPPAPPPPVVVRNVAPAPVAAPPAPAAPPPFVVPPAPPPPVVQWPVPWLPPILQPPPYAYPRPQSPPRGPKGPWPGQGGSRHGHGGD